jgi:hypothetical protein
MANARRVEGKQSGDVSRVRQSVDASSSLCDARIGTSGSPPHAAGRGSAVVMFADLITLFWLEIAVLGLFIAFWTVQTIELE